MKLKNSLVMKSSLFVAATCFSNIVTAAETLDSVIVSTTSLGQEETIEDVQATIEVLDQKFYGMAHQSKYPF